MRAFGLEARPVTTELRVGNWMLIDFIRRVPDPTYEQVLQLTADGAAGIVVGGGKPTWLADTLQWNRHLIAVVEGRWIVDASVDQADDPTRGLVLPGVLVHRFPKPVPMQPTTVTLRDPVTGTEIRYDLEPADRSYEIAPDWRLGAVAAATAEAIELAMLAWLAR